MPARCMIWPDIRHIVESFDGGAEAGIIYHNDDPDVIRVCEQTYSHGKIFECRIMHIADRLVDEVSIGESIATHSCIRASGRSKAPEYEKVDKRMLCRATRGLWGLRY